MHNVCIDNEINNPCHAHNGCLAFLLYKLWAPSPWVPLIRVCLLKESSLLLYCVVPQGAFHLIAYAVWLWSTWSIHFAKDPLSHMEVWIWTQNWSLFHPLRDFIMNFLMHGPPCPFILLLIEISKILIFQFIAENFGILQNQEAERGTRWQKIAEKTIRGILRSKMGLVRK